jgi:hypothetical protein
MEMGGPALADPEAMPPVGPPVAEMGYDWLANMARGAGRGIWEERYPLAASLGAVAALPAGIGALPAIAAVGGAAALGGLARKGEDYLRGEPVTAHDAMWAPVEKFAEYGLTEGISRGTTGALQKAMAPNRGLENSLARETVGDMRTAMDAAPGRSALGGLAQVRTGAVHPYEWSRAWLNDKLLTIAKGKNTGLDWLNARNVDRRKILVDQAAVESVNDMGRELSNEELAQSIAETIRGAGRGPGRVEGYLDLAKAPGVQIREWLRAQADPSPVQRIVYRRNADEQLVGRMTSDHPGITVDMHAAKTRVIDTIDEVVNTQNGTGSPRLDTWIKRFSSAEPTRNFRMALDDRDELRQIMRDTGFITDRGQRMNVRRIGRQLDSALTGEMRRGLADVDPDFASLLDMSDQIFANAYQAHLPRVIERATSLVDPTSPKQAEDIGTMLFGSRPGGTATTVGSQRWGQIKKALTHPETGEVSQAWRNIQAYYANHGLKDAIGPDGHVDGTRFLKWVANERAEGVNGRLAVIMGDRPEVIDNWRRIAKREQFLTSSGKSALPKEAALRIVETPDGGLGISVTRAAEAGGVVGGGIGAVTGGYQGAMAGAPLGAVLAGGAAMTGKALLGGKYASYVAARLLTGRQSSKWLAEGYTLAPGAKKAADVVAHITAQARGFEAEAQYLERARNATLSATQQGVTAVKKAIPMSGL